jgi:FMN phosphatase YigB (HAD superfamily)
VRGVLFDVDGTLYHQQPLRAFMAAELATALFRLGSVARARTLATVLQGYRRTQEKLREAPANGQSVASLQISLTAELTGVGQAEVETAVAEWMGSRPLRYLPLCRRRGLRPVLSELQRRNVRLGVLSDYPCESKLAALGIASFFSPILCAADPEINAFKPNPRGFLRACGLWNLAPHEVLYVGDRAEVDARGAQAAGLRCLILGRGGRRRADAAGHLLTSRLEAVLQLVGAVVHHSAVR